MRHPSTTDARGVALVEFALVLPLLLVLTLAVVDVSRAFWIKNVATQAAREGVRRLVVGEVADDSTEVRARVQQVVESSGVTLSDLTLTDADAGAVMEVEVEVQFDWLYPLLFSWLGTEYTNPVTLTAKAAMRKEG